MPQDPQDPQDPDTQSYPPPAQQPRKLAAALERAAAAGMFAAAGIAPPEPELTLEAALTAAREDLIREAIDGDSCHELAAQAYAVEALERLVYPLGHPTPAPEPEPLGDVADVAVELVEAVKTSGLMTGHFEGRFEPLLEPLEKLGRVLEAHGLQ